MERERIEQAIKDHCKTIGIASTNSYVAKNEENLIQRFPNWDEIKAELESGDGNELQWEGSIPPKFNAIHSSSALAVNNFAPFKQHIGDFSFYNYSNFLEGTFEKKLPTGISTPNLDFFLNSKTTAIGIESKFTEILKPKLPNSIGKGKTVGNLEKYLKRRELDFLPNGFEQEIIKYFILINSLEIFYWA